MARPEPPALGRFSKALGKCVAQTVPRSSEGPTTADELYLHIEHAVNDCGEKHVGICSHNSITPTVDDETYRATLQPFADERQRLGLAAPREDEVLFVPDLNSPGRMRTIADGCSRAATVRRVCGEDHGRQLDAAFAEVW